MQSPVPAWYVGGVKGNNVDGDDNDDNVGDDDDDGRSGSKHRWSSEVEKDESFEARRDKQTNKQRRVSAGDFEERMSIKMTKNEKKLEQKLWLDVRQTFNENKVFFSSDKKNNF